MFQIYLFTFLIIIIFFFTSKLLSDKRKVRLKAQIEKINLSFIQPELILPEIQISYKYYFGKGVYFGKGFLLLKDFMNDLDYEIGFNHSNLPYLSVDNQVFVSEEHIEAYLLDQFDQIDILVDPKQPYISNLEYELETNIGITQKEI